MTSHPDGGRRGRGIRRWAGPLVAAGVAAALVTVAALGFGWLDGSPGAPGLGGYHPVDQQQSGTCDGMPAAPAARLRLLSPGARVTGAVVCTQGYADIPGRGRWQVRRVVDVPATGIAALVAALRLPDRPGGTGACSAMLVVVPDFVLTLADGSRIRPGVPGDGCHPRAEVVSALRSAAAGAARSTVPLSQVATEQEVTTGCGGEAKSPAVWLDAGAGASTSDRTSGAAPTGVTGRPPLPPSGLVALCRYAPAGGSAADTVAGHLQGRLAATGTVPVGSVTALLAAITDTPPADQAAGCSPPHHAGEAPATGWLTILALPAPGSGEATEAPLLLVELGGCRRVIGGGSGTVLGYLGGDAGTALAALADRPAT